MKYTKVQIAAKVIKWNVGTHLGCTDIFYWFRASAFSQIILAQKQKGTISHQTLLKAPRTWGPSAFALVNCFNIPSNFFSSNRAINIKLSQR